MKINLPVAAAAAMLALAACSPDLTEDAQASELSGKVADVRAAAEAGDAESADEMLAELIATVEAMQADGELDEDKAAEIIAAAQDVEVALASAEPAVRDDEVIEEEEPIEEDLDDETKTKTKSSDSSDS